MPVEFDSKKKKEELQQQMQTTQEQQLQCWSSNIMATPTIHGFITRRTRKCHVSLLLMNSGSLKIVIEILIMAFPSFLGDSMAQTGQQALSMTLQDEKKRKRRETIPHIDGQDHAVMTETYHDGDGYMVFVSFRFVSSKFFLFFAFLFVSFVSVSYRWSKKGIILRS